MTTLRCNKCWKTPSNKAVSTICGHHFCYECATTFEHSHKCPGCDHPCINRGDLQEISCVPDPSLKRILCGYSPDVILESARIALAFWNNQKDVEQQYCVYQYKRELNKCTQNEKQLSEELLEHKNSLNRMSLHIKDLEDELNQEKLRSSELNEKYMEKTRQKRQFQELYETLRNKSDTNSFQRQTVHDVHVVNETNILPASWLRTPTLHNRSAAPPSSALSREQLRTPQMFASTRGDRFNVLRTKSPLSVNKTVHSIGKSFALSSRTPGFRKIPLFVKNQ
ncbi:hypothetical protein RCL1_005011 [Eukaryota sp. TZLM3-RCL]